MTISGNSGPIIVYGQQPSQPGTAYVGDYNGDAGPSAFAGGIMLLDPRYGYRAPLQAGSLAAIGFFESATHLVVDAVPSILAVANIAAAQNVVANVPMALVAASGAGIIISLVPLTVPQSGVTMPIGTHFIDTAPGQILYGQNGSVAAVDPRTFIGRAVSITSGAGSGGPVTVRGTDFYGFAMTEIITAVASTTVTGRKAFKSVTSATPGFTNAVNYSVGTSDVFGIPMLVTSFAQIAITWNNAKITVPTGLLYANVTTPATGITGDVRGTYAVQSPSDGTKRLQISVAPAPYNVATANGPESLFGPVQYSL